MGGGGNQIGEENAKKKGGEKGQGAGAHVKNSVRL